MTRCPKCTNRALFYERKDTHWMVHCVDCDHEWREELEPMDYPNGEETHHAPNEETHPGQAKEN